MDGVMVVIASDLHLIHHVLDEEESPATGSLRARQFRLQIWRLGIEDWSIAALVGDVYAQVRAERENSDDHRQLRSVLVAVLDGIHGRLAHGSLEALEAARGQPKLAHRLHHAIDRHPLVARRAG